MRLTMAGRLSECLLLSYSVPVADVLRLIPRGLELVTHRQHAFWNIVVSRIDAMRPSGAPVWTGIRYHHVAYRLQVTTTTARGERLSGLYFVRSDVDSRLVTLLGDALSDFHFHRARVNVEKRESVVSVTVESGDRAGQLALRCDTEPDQPIGSDLFDSGGQRESILKYRPLGLAVYGRKRARLAEVIRDTNEWRERPIAVTEANIGFFAGTDGAVPRLERATRVSPLEYRWRLGKTAQLRQSP